MVSNQSIDCIFWRDRTLIGVYSNASIKNGLKQQQNYNKLITNARCVKHGIRLRHSGSTLFWFWPIFCNRRDRIILNRCLEERLEKNLRKGFRAFMPKLTWYKYKFDFASKSEIWGAHLYNTNIKMSISIWERELIEYENWLKNVITWRFELFLESSKGREWSITIADSYSTKQSKWSWGLRSISDRWMFVHLCFICAFYGIQSFLPSHPQIRWQSFFRFFLFLDYFLGRHTDFHEKYVKKRWEFDNFQVTYTYFFGAQFIPLPLSVPINQIIDGVGHNLR